MPPPDLTEQDYSDLAALLREAIDAEPYRAGRAKGLIGDSTARLERRLMPAALG